MSIPRPEHPNPQFEREDWISLNGEWEFELDRGISGIDRKFYERQSLEKRITVPFCPESILSGIGNTDYLNCVWYLKSDFTKRCLNRDFYIIATGLDILYLGSRQMRILTTQKWNN